MNRKIDKERQQKQLRFDNEWIDRKRDSKKKFRFHNEIQIERQINTQIDRQIDRKIYRQIYRQIDRWIDRQKGSSQKQDFIMNGQIYIYQIDRYIDSKNKIL